MSAPLILRHCYENINPPAPNQIQVGELVINSRTGKLYTRLALDATGTPGPVVEFVGQQVCYDKVPTITYGDVSNFCCQRADILWVTVMDLIANNDYSFEIADISSNNVTLSIEEIKDESYTIAGPVNSTVSLKKATIPITVTISGSKNLTILKFTILLNNKELTSRTIPISCNNCGA
jgi:hypothetical protein